MRFVFVEQTTRVACFDVAESASSCALFAKNHKGCSVGIPTFSDIGAFSLFAHCEKTSGLEAFLDFEVGFTRWN